jgi:hypothetical protein
MKIAVVSLFLFLAGCASSSNIQQTGSPKGRPDVIVQHADMQSVADECARWAFQNGFSIDWTNGYSIGGTRLADSTAPFGELFAEGTHIEIDFGYAPEGDGVRLWADLHPVRDYYGNVQSRQWMQEELVLIAKAVVQKR